MVDTALAWIGAIGGIIGIGGFITGAISLKIASRANEIAEGAADSEKVSAEASQRAVTEAEQANRIAQQANEQARHANEIAEAVAATVRDRSQFKWVLKINDEGVVVGLRNDCADTACRVTVIVEAERDRVLDVTADEVAAFSVLPLDLDTFWQEHFEQLRSQKVKRNAAVGGIPISPPPERRQAIRVFVTWESQIGAPHSDVLECEVRHRLKDGVIVANSLPEFKIR